MYIQRPPCFPTKTSDPSNLTRDWSIPNSIFLPKSAPSLSLHSSVKDITVLLVAQAKSLGCDLDFPFLLPDLSSISKSCQFSLQNTKIHAESTPFSPSPVPTPWFKPPSPLIRIIAITSKLVFLESFLYHQTEFFKCNLYVFKSLQWLSIVPRKKKPELPTKAYKFCERPSSTPHSLQITL